MSKFFILLLICCNVKLNPAFIRFDKSLAWEFLASSDLSYWIAMFQLWGVAETTSLHLEEEERGASRGSVTAIETNY